MIRCRKKKPNASARDLEKLTVRIYKLIEPKGAVVTWNKKIRDPDTGQLRQIDGMIERDGKKTHIECRDHESVQDVQWIEGLIGRRKSLRADGMIGVSLSGFTKPAEIKAKAAGVILRTFSEMTDAEIESWGTSIKLNVNYVDISALEIAAVIDLANAHLLSSQPRLHNVGEPASPEFLIIQELVKQGGDHFVSDRSTSISADISFPNFFVDSAPVLYCKTKMRGSLLTQGLNIIGVWNYHGAEPEASIEAIVSKHGRGLTEIIQRDDNVTMILDFSSIVPPDNCFFHTFQIDFGRNVKAQFEPLGIPHLYNFTINASLGIKAVAQLDPLQEDTCP